MTKERRLAIQMWEEIKEQLPYWFTSDRYTISEKILAFKVKFCEDNQLNWMNHCWLCQYVRGFRRFNPCTYCLLKTCGYGPKGASPWQVVMQWRYSLELKLKACDTIIAALKGVQNGNNQ